MEPVYRALEIAAHAVTRVQGMRLDVRDEDKLPRAGGVILAVNHTGYVDFLPAALAVYRAGRRARYMIKSEMMANPLVRFLILHTHTVPVDRSAGSAAYAQAVRYLREGYVIGVYPEATISRSFELKEFKTGAVRMAAAAAVPVVPLIVWGSQRQWTKGAPRAMGRRKIKVAVRFGDPITVAPGADPADETARLRQTMATLLDEVRRDYGRHPAGARWVPASMGGGAPTLEQARELERADEQRRAHRAGRDSGGSGR